MRYPKKNISSLDRLKRSRDIPTVSKDLYYWPKAQKTQSEDTRIRQHIYEVIRNMIQEGKVAIQIEIYLTDMYPNYSEYILKMINHHFTKLNSSKVIKDKDTKDGDER